MVVPPRVDERKMRARFAIVVSVAVVLAATAIAVMLLVPSSTQFAHQRSHGWERLSMGILLVSLLLARLPSRLLSVAVGILAGGTLGNLVWAETHGWVVPNPFVVRFGGGGIAFNPADVLVVVGTLLFVGAAMRVTIRYRHVLPQSTVAVRLVRRLFAR